jgi:hypothetical protein
VAANHAGVGGGAWESAFTNCIVYYNSPLGSSNQNNVAICTINSSCTYSAGVLSTGNISNAPLFVDLAGGDLHLQGNSPCINAGANRYVSSLTDLDGNPRIEGGTVDIGAYEFQSPSSVISYAWLQKYGLPNDGSADYADPDHDGFTTRQEWIAGTDPTDNASTLRLLSTVHSASGTTVTWTSVANRLYTLQCATNLAVSGAFSILRSNIIGASGTTSYTDASAIGSGPFFYRVGVQN